MLFMRFENSFILFYSQFVQHPNQLGNGFAQSRSSSIQGQRLFTHPSLLMEELRDMVLGDVS